MKSNSSKPNIDKRVVSFDQVEIREYPVILGNNPASHYGPSIELGWEYNIPEATPMPVDKYERTRQPQRLKKQKYLYLSQVKREDILKQGGYPEKELKKAVQEKQRARRHRQFSQNTTSPLVVINRGLRAGRTNKKVKRAVRNLNKETANQLKSLGLVATIVCLYLLNARNLKSRISWDSYII